MITPFHLHTVSRRIAVPYFRVNANTQAIHWYPYHTSRWRTRSQARRNGARLPSPRACRMSPVVAALRASAHRPYGIETRQTYLQAHETRCRMQHVS